MKWLLREAGVLLDRTIPGSGSRIRPDIYFDNLGGKRVILDIGGPSKVRDILKYQNLADYVIPLLH